MGDCFRDDEAGSGCVQSPIVSVSSPRIAVYCGGNAGNDPVFAATARTLGETLVQRGYGLVYGGGHVGLMGALADAVLAAGGEAIGVITEQLVSAEIAHPRLTTLEIVASMHERKARMTELADGIIVLPGGFGTLDEVFEALTWNQLGIVAKPVVFVDVNGYYRGLFEFLDVAAAAGLLRPEHRAMAQSAATVDAALALLDRPAPATMPKWIDRDLI